MSNNKDAQDLLNKKRESKRDYADQFTQDTRKNDLNAETGFSMNLRSSDIFADPNSAFMLQNKRDPLQGPLSQVYNTTSGYTPKYGGFDSNLPLHDNSFQSSKGIFTPLSPGYNTPKNTVSIYNIHELQKNKPTAITPAYANHTFVIPNSKIVKDSTNADSDLRSDITTPSRTANEVNIPDLCAPKLQNIVSTVNLKCPLELRDIALKAKNAEYNPKRFAAVIMRIREPKTTALIFASGKMVCTGARSEEDSRKASRQYAKIIQKLGYAVKFAEFKIQNIVGSCDVRFPIRLEGLAARHSNFCSYEPEMFPGLIYRMGSPKIVLLIFVSGKIVLTGAKERADIFQAYTKIYPVLLEFKKKESAQPILDENSSVSMDSTSNYHPARNAASISTRT